MGQGGQREVHGHPVVLQGLGTGIEDTKGWGHEAEVRWGLVAGRWGSQDNACWVGTGAARSI